MLAERGRAAGLRPEEWNSKIAQWQAAERELMQGGPAIQRQVVQSAWLQEAWSELISQRQRRGSDEVAVHFRSEGGELQRQVIEWFVGELTLQTYTFTDRLKYGVPGSEQEMKDLQVITYERKDRFPPIYDLTGYPGAIRFASTDPGA